MGNIEFVWKRLEEKIDIRSYLVKRNLNLIMIREKQRIPFGGVGLFFFLFIGCAYESFTEIFMHVSSIDECFAVVSVVRCFR